MLLVRKGTEIEFAGEQHFSYYEKDGNASNQFAFIMIILFEIPLAHLLLHFVWSPLGALIITIITAYGLLWMIGNYRATIKRPISISNESLYVRYGLLGNTKVNLRSIENAQMVGGRVRRRKEIVRHVAAGSANVKLELKKKHVTQECSWYRAKHRGSVSCRRFTAPVYRSAERCDRKGAVVKWSHFNLTLTTNPSPV